MYLREDECHSAVRELKVNLKVAIMLQENQINQLLWTH
jgi:hypothetical protein